jgi:hypothetical protein
MQEGLELEKMQVPPGPLYAIMDRLIGPATGRTPQTFGIASAVEVALSLIGCKANPGNLPGFLETGSGCKKRRSIHVGNDLNAGSIELLGYANFHPKRKSAAISPVACAYVCS